MIISAIKKLLLLPAILLSVSVFSQNFNGIEQQAWVDSVFASLTDDQRLGQLMVLRLSATQGGGVVFYDKEVEEGIRKYNIGSICLFQGGPVQQAQIINRLQLLAKTPLMVCIDGETGVGMRFTDSVGKFPDQLTMGALQDGGLVYKVGRAIGEQCKRIGIHVNYAPVVDINNNPDNPVINFRSFGEDKYMVSLLGNRIMRGMQDVGVMACAKHFPGHGDVAVDSHLDLPVITKTKLQLDSLELYPFRNVFNEGIGSVMVAHLYIPAIDSTPNRATSISYNNVTRLLRSDLDYQGLTFTDALEMKGVSKFFPGGEASVESLIAGNDMLCLPGNVDTTMAKIKAAIESKRLSWNDIYEKVRKVLKAKYQYVLPNAGSINTNDITADLNADIPALRKQVAENSITLLRNDSGLYPLQPVQGKKVAYVGVGLTGDNAISQRMKLDYKADVYYFDYRTDEERATLLADSLKAHYDVVVTGVHNYRKYPANNFGMSPASMLLIRQLQDSTHNITLFFGNPYAAAGSCDAKTVLVCYEDDSIFHHTAADVLEGLVTPRGKLPVTICERYPSGTGIVNTRTLPSAPPASVGFEEGLAYKIDSIALDAISKKAMPGCVVLVAKDGKIAYEKAFGTYSIDSKDTVTAESIYDLASLTKVFATTVSIMKLYDDGKLDLKKKLGDYLPAVKGSNKENLVIEDILLHQAGLSAYIPFYRETVNPQTGVPYYTIYSRKPVYSHSVRVAENMYIRNDWSDTLFKRILDSPLGPRGKYVYSDNDFIFLGKIVEAISGVPLNEFVQYEFYNKLNMVSTGFRPRERFPLNHIVPTERERGFRMQLLRGDVHDPGAAMFGEVAGHAGLFSAAYDLAVISQMLLNGGIYGGRRFLNKETIDLFTGYQSKISRRGYGFDKPEKDNPFRDDPYPSKLTSPLTYGHTGFTGTCVWIDPASKLVYIFLSNRVNAFEPGQLGKLLVRSKIQDEIYGAIRK
ncbi:MAG: serine hydrolase [Chitinophagaceae bacterium]|nr:serine hydrolase [Chitinophagaceae bacterium]